jgi:hypothetical protein
MPRGTVEEFLQVASQNKRPQFFEILEAQKTAALLASKEAEEARERLDKAQITALDALKINERAQITPNPDAIIGPHNWVYLVTQAAKVISTTVNLPEDGTLTPDSYRTIKRENAQHFANELRKHGLTVAE